MRDGIRGPVTRAAGLAMVLDAAAVETGVVSRLADGEPLMVRWTVRVDEDTHKYAQLRGGGTPGESGT